jgi:hypothetical protein
MLIFVVLSYVVKNGPDAPSIYEYGRKTGIFQKIVTKVKKAAVLAKMAAF